MKIMPAPLEQSAEDLQKQLERLTPYFNSYQIDIADGIFVPNKTVQLREIAWVLKEFPDIIIDFHLMVQDWQRALETIDELDGVHIRYVLIHSKTNPPAEAFKIPHRYKMGMVINPDERIETIQAKYDLSFVQSIQIMTVTPGFQGQAFIEDSGCRL
jgi:ribulose-phosphate 3-epimerase